MKLKNVFYIPSEKQSQVAPGPEKVHYSKFNKSASKVLKNRVENVKTLYDTFSFGAQLSNNGNCLGWRGGPNRSYVWQSYNETLSRAKNFGSGLINLGLNPGQDSILGIYLENCPEWIMSELAAYCYSMVVVPLYHTLGTDACKFIVEQTKMSVVICEDDIRVDSLLELSISHLKTIVTLKEISPAVCERAKCNGVTVYTFKDVEDIGSAKIVKCVLPKPDDLCTVCYTSGTTGIPKGVMLSHSNVVAAADAVAVQIGDHWFNNNDVMLSFLPLAHMLERFIEHMLLREGGAIGFFSGNIANLNEDIATLKPTVMVSVPRLLNKMYEGITNSVSQSKFKNLMFKLALAAKGFEVKRGIIRNDSIWDRIMFKKIQKGMGGRLRMLITSSAPVSKNILHFIRCALGCQVIEGYGQTECLVASCTLCGETDGGHVGPPVPCCIIKLIDVPEMNYYTANDQGEVCVKGSNVFKGYYKETEQTKEVLGEDGWLRTGDIGQWHKNGALQIIDRRKHIFKLSQGEFIVPEKIENVYLRSLYVEQVVVHGESLKSCIVAIVVPNKNAIINLAMSKDIAGPFTELCADKRVKNIVIKDMVLRGKEAGLKSFEQVKDIHLHPELFLVRDGLLTPTLKTKRREIMKVFKNEIRDMYKTLS